MPAHSKNSGDNGRVGAAALFHFLLWPLGFLVLLGIYNVYSATYYVNLAGGAAPYKDAVKHVGILLGSIVLGYGLTYCPWIWRSGRSLFLWAAGITLLLAAVWAGGVTVNGAKRWLQFGGFSLQPSEFAKAGAILFTAWMLAKRMEAGKTVRLLQYPWFWVLRRSIDGRPVTWERILWGTFPLVLPAFFFLIVMEQPDMGTAALILVFPMLLYFLAGLSWWEVSGGILLVVLGVAWLVREPYRWERIMSYWDPFDYAGDEGYQAVQSLIAVGSGGFWGQGLGVGTAKFFFLPERSTDFAYAVLSQEGGFAIAFLVLLLFGMVLVTGFLIAKEMADLHAALVVYGMTLLLSVQGMGNIAMVLGLIPVTGVPLPFISYGGSALMTNCMAVGIIGSAVRFDRKYRKKAPPPETLPLPRPVPLEPRSHAVFQPPADDRFRQY